MAKIYTKSGDDGITSLVDGSRVSKSDQRIALYGEVDELNSYIGYCISHLRDIDSKQSKLLGDIQTELFNIGSNLACPQEKREGFKLPTLSKAIVEKLEKYIDELDSSLEPLKNFILPGGHIAASVAHILRTKTRSLERSLVLFKRENSEEIPDEYLKFFNRLSDYFFVLARYINDDQEFADKLWQGR